MNFFIFIYLLYLLILIEYFIFNNYTYFNNIVLYLLFYDCMYIYARSGPRYMALNKF